MKKFFKTHDGPGWAVLIVAFILNLLLGGCSKKGADIVQPPPIVVVQKLPTVTATTPTTSVWFKASPVVDYSANDADSVLVNGKKLSALSGSIPLTELQSDTTLAFAAKNKFGVAGSTLSLHVYSPFRTLLCQYDRFTMSTYTVQAENSSNIETKSIVKDTIQFKPNDSTYTNKYNEPGVRRGGKYQLFNEWSATGRQLKWGDLWEIDHINASGFKCYMRKPSLDNANVWIIHTQEYIRVQ
ncbi:MAG: hypothetical protein V4665_03730 [Patescibacteria group bacterium]